MQSLAALSLPLVHLFVDPGVPGQSRLQIYFVLQVLLELGIVLFLLEPLILCPPLLVLLDEASRVFSLSLE